MKTPTFATLGALLIVAPLFTLAASDDSLTDANIAAIVVAANDIDIKAGKLAQKTSNNTAVKTLGEVMVRDHEAVNAQAHDLVKKLHVTPQDNDLSKKLRADAAAIYANLEAKTGAEFDRAYAANEVTYHEAVISVIETTLLPAVENPELRALLEQVVPALRAHLEHAQHVARQLN